VFLKSIIKKITYSSSVICFLYSTSLGATTLRDVIEQTINNNPDVMSEHYNKKANRENIQGKKAGYYPSVKLKVTAESQKLEKKPDDAPYSAPNKDGWTATLSLEQVIYNGGKTQSEVKQVKHKYNNIKYTSTAAIEDIILDVTNTYLDLILNQSLKAFGDFKIVAYNYYLKLANEKEDISGEILDKLQVQSKIQSLIDSNLEQDVKAQKTLSTYTKLSNNTIEGNICRPVLNESLIPNTLEEAIKIALKSNYKIKAQYELIQEQKAKIEAFGAKFKPDLKLQLDAQTDNDLALANNGTENTYNAKLVSTWNLYKGGADSSALTNAKITMLKERKVLDAIKAEVIDEIKTTYTTYYKLKKRIANLKKFVSTNNQIVDVYRQQLKEGSRTFLDLLNAETEVFRTRILLEEQDIRRYKEYFNILKNLNILSDVVLLQRNQICKKFDINSILPNYDEQYKKNESNSENNIEEQTKELGLEE